MIKKIKVVTYTKDLGDGSSATWLYNNADELFADQFGDETLSASRRKQVLANHSPYEDGYVGRESLMIQVDDDGNLRLATPFSSSAG